MQKQQAQIIVKETFQNAFDKERFIRFVKELLNHVEPAPFVYRGNLVPDAYEQHISTLERIGKYTDGEHEVDILIVKLKKTVSIERARTMQRNFIAWYLNGSRGDKMKDAALVAFVSPNEQDWRFSLVKMEYKFEEGKNKKMKVREEFTPAKRWSFLVGINENSHTAQSRLAPIVEDDEHNPTLQQLEDAFNIEKVTKEFFEKYRDLFLRVSETLEGIVEKKDGRLKKDFADKNVSIADFTKKLLGQIVFLYFLQKKGWFGVPMNKVWGEGDKKFIRTLFEKAQTESKNYFNDFLEPLFYEALAKERDEDFYSRFESKIPFLNGGLFDPISNYDWVNTAIDLPDDLFSNTRKTKQGDVGDGILDIFDRYNFTVKEDEPLEKEVAVDPEMLGKVFENLLEVKDRKSKGTYYTPREIVHYMCEQSLINYLATELEAKVPKEAIEQLVKYGEAVGENEARVEKEGRETDAYYYKLPESIRENAEDIDTALATIKVCDPAIGSGAFPVGMMSEIVKARSVLSAYLKGSDRTVYNFKRDCIQNSLYGVDIDPGAVEIAKLRLWLSLVVDEDDIKQIKPLPNLDYKIMQGNSLLEEFEGVKLFDENLLASPVIDTNIFAKENQRIASVGDKLMGFYKGHPEWQWSKKKKSTKPQEVINLENELRLLRKRVSQEVVPKNLTQPPLSGMAVGSKKIRDELAHLHKSFFEETNKGKKDQLRKQIDALEWQLIEATLREEKKTPALEKLEEFKHANVKPFFLWKLHFADVFEEKGGFDVIIGNPPYLRIQGMQKSQAEMIPFYRKSFESAQGSFDLYALFIERGYKFLSSKGQLVYIVPNKFFQASFGKKLREMITSRQALDHVVKFGAEQVFENPTTYTCLLFLSAQPREHFNFVEVKSISNLERTMNAIIENKESPSFISATLPAPTGDEWNFQAGKTADVLQKINKQPQRLGDIVEKIFQGIATSADKIYVLKIVKEGKEMVRLFSTSLQEGVEIEKGLLRPFLMGKDVHRYQNPVPKNYVIFPYHENKGKMELMAPNYIKKEFPMGWKYLLNNRQELENREKGRMKHENFYAYIYPKNLNLYHLPKVMTPEIALGGQMTYDSSGVAHTTKVYSFVFKKGLQEDLKYWLGLLNSKVLWFFLSNTGYVLRGGYFTFKTNYLTPFPIRRIDFGNPKEKERHDKIVDLVDRILQKKKIDKNFNSLKYEMEIDVLVNNLYGLTKEDTTIIQSV